MEDHHQADRTCDIFVLNSGDGGFVQAALLPATRVINEFHEDPSAGGAQLAALQQCTCRRLRVARRRSIAPKGAFGWPGARLRGRRNGNATFKRIDRLAVHI